MYHPKYNDSIFFGMITSFLCGVFIRSFVEVGTVSYFTFLGVSFVFAIYFFRFTKMKALIVLLCALMMVFGSLRLELWHQHSEGETLASGVSSEYQARIVSPPEFVSNHQRFLVRLLDESYRGKILVTTDRYPEYRFGDHVSLDGKLQKPKNFVTDSGREFDYVSYLEKDRIYYSMPFADVSLIESKAFGSFRSLLFSVKTSFLKAIERIIPDPESALLGGILLGVKQSLGDELEQSFIDTGTIHIVVLSGYNVTIVSEAIVRTFQSFLSERVAFSFGAFGIALFALLTGLGTTTVRASVMGLLGLLARVTGRTYDIVRALFLAAFCMVLWNPMTLAFDVSFQLSFIATLGLILITPIIESWRFVRYLPSWIGIRSIFASTIATQIAVLPYILYKIGTLSIISPLANLLVLPVIPLAMGLGFGAGLVEMVSTIGSQPLAWFAFLILRYVIEIVQALASFSWSSVVVPPVHAAIVLLLYIGIGLWLYFTYRNPLFRLKLSS